MHSRARWPGRPSHLTQNKPIAANGDAYHKFAATLSLNYINGLADIAEYAGEGNGPSCGTPPEGKGAGQDHSLLLGFGNRYSALSPAAGFGRDPLGVISPAESARMKR
jgi:hypothetical protein